VVRVKLEARNGVERCERHAQNEFCDPSVETKGESYRLHDAKSRARRPKSRHDEPTAEEVATAVTGPAAAVVPEPVDNSQAAV
jgi:hypothetical protein